MTSHHLLQEAMGMTKTLTRPNVAHGNAQGIGAEDDGKGEGP